MSIYLYSFLIAGAAGMLWFWSQQGWSEIFQRNHPYQALVMVFVLCGLGTAILIWVLSIFGIEFSTSFIDTTY
ncbi:MAG: hypothetical protein DIZ78_08220 [endosymbiont of Escarpia spicata]|uniref:DUF1146 domain-containing protein n=1 Tax=endosymbiont of Escarpia spicata TaxID=2200908 RepID=A0A370DMN5_9GAMM|nr:MAG: hypothetical protein DIZ78_08220 [endosymbiont of Escarpia spicata]